MKWLLLLLMVPLTGTTINTADIIIKNGKIVDGTGNNWYYADIAIKEGKILKIGRLTGWTAKKTIDATGLMVAPGFIDVHTHIEDDELKNPFASNFIYDGVTTVVTGNCGSSRIDIGSYFSLLDSVKLAVNVASLVGHNDVRRMVLGRANREPNAVELEQMKAIVEKAMKEGAVGLSTGLQYTPGAYSKTYEIVELAKVAAQYNGVYASHMRNEGDSVTHAINETLQIGREAKIPVQISHLKVGGQQNWGRSQEIIEMVKQARIEGIEVTVDQYPYTASSTSLNIILPDWVLADNADSIRARLARPAVKAAVKEEMLRNLNKRKLKHYDYAVIAYHRADTSLNGKSIEAINLIRGRKHNANEEIETIFELVVNGGAQMIYHGMSEPDIKYIMQYPYNMFASDASIRIFNQGVPHPRGYGTNARVLGKYVRDEKVITLEEAIRRMTSLPAQKFRLKDRGLLKEGMAADIVVFNEQEVRDMATFEKPHQYAQGFKFVLVNGALTVENAIQNQVRNGQVLKNNP